ncbi:hypothetical protein Cni_G22009 [Canna indica]|uniref:Uncharacterized protein n=1 Tax=Canna indica TaxID=4628 RepID=A0AAQ3KR59_9LILI|nr:hypothetical protein Cni_G22009 [Canna indica]
MAAVRNALLSHLRVRVDSLTVPAAALSFAHVLRCRFSDEVKGFFLHEFEVTDGIITVVKNFQKVDPLQVGQDEFHGEVLDTLGFVVNQSDFTVEVLRNVTDFLSLAKTISVDQIYLPLDVENKVDKLNVDLNDAANTLSGETAKSSGEVKRVFADMSNFTMRTLMEEGAGIFKVVIVRGNNLALRDFTSSDPYVVVKLGKQIYFVLNVTSRVPIQILHSRYWHGSSSALGWLMNYPCDCVNFIIENETIPSMNMDSSSLLEVLASKTTYKVDTDVVFPAMSDCFIAKKDISTKLWLHGVSEAKRLLEEAVVLPLWMPEYFQVLITTDLMFMRGEK